jgi:tetratricopeptide (TPR) repeat protein
MTYMTQRNGQRSAAVILLATTAVLTGCAATALPVTRPEPGLAAERVPSVPVGASDELAAAWAALRIGDAVPLATALSPADRASAIGQTYEGFRGLRSGDILAARNAFGAALGGASQLAAAQYGMGLTAELQGRYDLAADWFEAALRTDSGLTRAAVELNRLALASVSPNLRRAELAVQSGDVAAAEAAYREVVAQAPFLAGPYLRIAELHLMSGDTAAAIDVLEGARRTLGDQPAVLHELGELFMGEGRYAEAADAYQRIADQVPDDIDAANRARSARDAYEQAELPSEYRTLAAKDALTREELAAVLAIHLPGLEARAAGRPGVIVADAGDRWTTRYVLRTVQWGVLDVYQNNEFYPRMEVLRSMLVEASYRILELVGAADSAPRPALSDPPSEHVLYRQVQAIVGLHILDTGAHGGFDLLEPVSGAEALRAVERLAVIVRQYGS